MLKSILLLLEEENAAGRVAAHLALDVAKELSARVTGVERLIRPLTVTPYEMLQEQGIQSDPVRRAAREAEDAEHHSHAEAFLAAAKAAGVDAEVLEEAGSVLHVLQDQSQRHDLILLGRDNAVGPDRVDRIGDTIVTLLRGGGRPLLVSGDRAADIRGDIIMGYDGSAPAQRTLQMLCLLGFGEKRAIHLYAIRGGEKAEAALEDAGAYLANRNMRHETRIIDSKDPAADVILQEARAQKAGFIAMGAFGHRGWREHVIGSSTQAMLRFSSLPLFLCI